MIRLRNIAIPPHPLTIQLPHDKYCAVAGVCMCTVATSGSVRKFPNGRGRGVVTAQVMMPGSITVWPRGMKGSESQLLHPVVAELGPVAAAINKRELVVVQNDPPAPSPRPNSPSVQAQEKPPERAASMRKDEPRQKKGPRSNG